jgi:hypothetical protein
VGSAYGGPCVAHAWPFPAMAFCAAYEPALHVDPRSLVLG